MKCKWVLVAYILLSFLAITPSFAQQDDGSGKLVEYLVQEKTNLTIANNNAKLLSEPKDQHELTLQKQQNEAMLALVQAKIVSLDSFLANQRKHQQNLFYNLKNIEQLPLGKSEGMVAQEQINKINTLIDVNNKTIELITEDLTLAHRYQEVLLAKSHQFNLWQAKMDEQQRLESLHKRIEALGQARNNLYQQNVELQQAKKDTSFNTTFNNEAKLLLNNQVVILIQHRITELELQEKLIKANYLQVKNQDVKTLQSVADIYKNAISQLVMIEQSLNKMIGLLKNEQALISDSHLKQQFLTIQKTASLRLHQINVQQQTLQKEYEDKEHQLKKQLSINQGLVEYHLTSWPVMMNQLLLIPSSFYNYMKPLVFKVRDNYIWQDVWPAVFYWISIGLILFIAFVLSGILRAVTMDKERSRLSGYLYDGFLILLHRNIPQLAFLSIILVTFFINHIPYTNYLLFANLLLVWLAFRNLILIARLALLERISDASGQDVRLYYRLKWLFILGGWATAMMIFSHERPLSLLLQDLFNRLFMLFLLAVSLVIWKSKDIIPYLLWPFLKTKKRYFRNAISLLTILAPLIVFTTAIIGLVGYFSMAWAMSRYQAYLLIVITSYVLVRGLLLDAMELLSEWMISSLQNGWLWIAVALKPLDKILRVSLLLVSIILLFQLFGWYSDAQMMARLQRFWHYALVNTSGIHITFLSAAEFFLLLFTFVWVAKWTREFCYRWLYRNARDIGVRNSLSVFTQYAVIVIGAFITLRVLGLDFSGLSMVLGGLAVGLGFGLRDFASNIVGGFMLLIERPVRVGDLITLGEYEGRVAHIGIRSMRVSSWDNMEVLIPNAETFNKPFTNWTHQDSVVRTVVPIKVSRADNPAMVQQLIMEVLTTIPEILSDPMPQVLLTQIDDALIEFEVRYFINVQLYTRFEIRSKVLFAIMEKFEEVGIQPPIPPISIELKED